MHINTLIHTEAGSIYSINKRFQRKHIRACEATREEDEIPRLFWKHSPPLHFTYNVFTNKEMSIIQYI